ncbi:glycosyltransferase family 2 protein [Polaribacter sp. IC073]|uniref:glycosyltransferase family 2 protein n=1 Tax=Polaribacter sp. IC073 TaxID=2508540 RepID=UPI0011BD93FF|nr:glycosyltransferase family 2 protein [Polaribacter sp. IC073]TXD49691.1 glycosyltransferase family 2 protein [Polaribacter sp. IC073]
MNKKFKITATIVLYKENISVLEKTIESFLQVPFSKKLFLVDNSPTDKLKNEFNHPEIIYIFVGKNIGFGKAHNSVLDKINSEFHLILNPDVIFTSDVIPNLIKVLNKEPEVSFITPKVLYPNKEVQYVCRKHPTCFNLINRKLKFSSREIKNNEYQNKDLEKSFYPEFIHGCFMFFKTEDFKRLKGFDCRYFLYMEDADLCRKIDDIGKKKLYYPKVDIIHQHQKGSSKRIKLFLYHLSSAFKYFLKWGF